MPDDFMDTLLSSAQQARPARLSMVVSRELGEGDLDLVRNPPPVGMAIKPRARMKNSHHLLARLLAEGRRPQECSAILGYAPSTISIMQGDPAFQELVSYYSGQVKEVFLDVHQRLANLGVDAIEELQERLAEDPEAFSHKELMAITELTMDRSVAPAKGGPKAQGNGGGLVQLNIQFVEPKAQGILEVREGAKVVEAHNAKGREGGETS